jgi:thioredoxin 1
MSVENLTVATFEAQTKTGVVLVDFWAPWCGPCRALSPVIEELEKDSAGKFRVLKVNIDDEPELTKKFEVLSIPTVFILKDGKMVDQFVGRRDKKTIAALVAKHL